MKNPRKALAIVCGLLFCTGYSCFAGGNAWISARLLCGVLLSTGITVSMIQNPARITRPLVIFVTGPLLAALVIFEGFTASPWATAATFLGALAFFAAQLKFASLPPDPPTDPSPESTDNPPN